MPGTQKHKPSNALLRKLAACLRKGEERLMDRVLAHAMAHGYSKYTSTLKEAWRISVSGLTTSFASTIEDSNFVVELGPDQDYRSDPVAAFAIVEAQRHRQRGIRLEMFLGFLKYYRQSYRDVIQDDGGLGAGDKDIFAYIIFTRPNPWGPGPVWDFTSPIGLSNSISAKLKLPVGPAKGQR